MKKRYIYSLLFGVPGLFVAGMLSILLFGALAGLLWLYVFGDNSWPAASEGVLSILFVIVFLVLWIGFIGLGYGIGKRLEHEPGLKRSHILISAGLSLLFLLAMVAYQLGVGHLGPGSDSILCSDFCARHGYSASSMPPRSSGDRTCSCYDEGGNEVMRIPLDHLAPGGP